MSSVNQPMVGLIMVDCCSSAVMFSRHSGQTSRFEIALKPMVKAMMVTTTPNTIARTKFKLVAAKPVRLGFTGRGFEDLACAANLVPIIIEMAMIAWIMTQIQTSKVVFVTS